MFFKQCEKYSLDKVDDPLIFLNNIKKKNIARRSKESTTKLL